MPLLPGYKRVQTIKVSARTGRRYNYTSGYITPRGKRISRYAYDSLRLKRVGFGSRSELERFQRDIAGSRWLSDIYEAQGGNPSWDDFALLREVRDRRVALGRGFREDYKDEEDPALVSPRGPLAKLLARAGKRPLSGYAVGDSP